MAGYGFGGLGASYPMRTGAPQSQQVYSNDEWTKNWNDRLASISPTIATPLDLISGNTGFNAGGAAPYVDGINAANNSAFTSAFGNSDAANNVLSAANNLGVVVDRNSSGDPTIGVSAYGSSGTGGSHVLGGQYTYEDNPAYAEAAHQMQMETAARGANQISQQQAYNGMLGNGQMNGVIGPGYSTPGFGQVTGQADPFGVGTSQGSDATFSTGSYNPGGVYKPNANKTFWGL